MISFIAFSCILEKNNRFILKRFKVFVFVEIFESLKYSNLNTLKSSTKTRFGANEVIIYNFLALITIDTNINQFTKVYHIFDKLQQNL